MTKLTGAALDRAVANAMGLKSVNNCEKWGENMKEHFCPAEKSMITYQGECSWCGESEGSMTQEALKLALEALEYWDVHGKLHQPTEEAITAIKEALAQTQEPFAYVNIEKRKLEFAHDYVKWDTPTTVKLERIPLYTAPPQRTERPVDCERCNRLEEQAYDLVGKLRVANIKLSMQPQRKPLTDEELFKIWLTVPAETEGRFTFARAIEVAHGIKE